MQASGKLRSAGVPKGTRRAVYKRDGYQCATCGDVRGLQIHHVTPRSRGGSDDPRNLVTLCWKCHAIAHGTTLPDVPDYIDAEWMEDHIAEYLGDYYAEFENDAWVQE